MIQINQKPVIENRLSYSRRVFCGGQGLVEYSLLLSIVAVGSISALMVFGSNTSTMLGSITALVSGNQASSTLVNAAPPSGTGQTPLGSTPTPVAGSNNPANSTETPPLTNGAQNQTTCFANASWCINMTGGQSAAVNVTGANGMTQHVYAMADILKQISSQAVEDPSVDPSLAQLITDLANKAHAVGDYDAQLFALHQNSGVAYFEAAAFMKAKQAVEGYLSVHPNGLIAGVQQALNYATGEVTDHMAALIGSEPSATENDDNLVMYSNMQSAINEYTASQTHENANQICENGGQPPSCIVPQ